MGWTNVLVNWSRGLRIDIGKVEEYEFVDACDNLSRVLSSLPDLADAVLELEDVKIKDVTVKQARTLTLAVANHNAISEACTYNGAASFLYLRWKGTGDRVDILHESDARLHGDCQLKEVA